MTSPVLDICINEVSCQKTLNRDVLVGFTFANALSSLLMAGILEASWRWVVPMHDADAWCRYMMLMLWLPNRVCKYACRHCSPQPVINQSSTCMHTSDRRKFQPSRTGFRLSRNLSTAPRTSPCESTLFGTPLLCLSPMAHAILHSLLLTGLGCTVNVPCMHSSSTLTRPCSVNNEP